MDKTELERLREITKQAKCKKEEQENRLETERLERITKLANTHIERAASNGNSSCVIFIFSLQKQLLKSKPVDESAFDWKHAQTLLKHFRARGFDARLEHNTPFKKTHWKTIISW